MSNVIPRPSRFPTDLTVAVACPPGSAPSLGRVKNLHKGGLMIDEPNLFGGVVHSGDSIGVELEAGAEHGRVVLLGEVRWCEDGRAGVQVRAMMPHHRARYEQLVGKVASAHGIA